MAIFRKVHTSFWSDPFIQDLTIEQRYFYLYILTNEQTKQCGIYEVSKKQISFDTGYSIDKVSTLLAYFINAGKIRYNEITKELAVGKWLKYNNSTSPTIKSCINKEFESVKDRVLIEYVCSMDTTSQEEQEQEQEQEQDAKNIKSKDLESNSLKYLQTFNEVYNTNHTSITPVKTALSRVLKDYTIEQVCEAIKRSTTSDAWVADKLKSNHLMLLNQKNKGGQCDYVGSILNSNYKPKYKFQPKAISSELPQQTIQLLHEKFGLPLDWNEYELPSRSYFIKTHQNQDIKRYFL